jgi:hypothetical protein
MAASSSVTMMKFLYRRIIFPALTMLIANRPEPFTEYNLIFIIAKTKKKNTVFVKIHERSVQRFESSIICAIKQWHKSGVTSFGVTSSGVTSSGVGVALKPEQTT